MRITNWTYQASQPVIPTSPASAVTASTGGAKTLSGVQVSISPEAGRLTATGTTRVATPQALGGTVTGTSNIASTGTGLAGSVALTTAYGANQVDIGINLKAGITYSFASASYSSSAKPSITLIDSNGKATKMALTKSFRVAADGNYTIRWKAGSKGIFGANLNMSIVGESMLPASSGDKNIDALINGGNSWWREDPATGAALSSATVKAGVKSIDGAATKDTIRFGFLTASPAGASAADQNGFAAMSTDTQAAVRRAFEMFGNMLNVQFVEDNSGSAEIQLGMNSQSGSAGYAYQPNGSPVAGKSFVYLNKDDPNTNTTNYSDGTFGWYALIHEIGHALGLKHPGNYNGAGGGRPPFIAKALDNRQNSMMSYKDNGASSGATNATPMALDIAALQYLYGAKANSSTADGSGNFAFSNPSQRYLKTLWSNKGTDTIDLTGLTNSSVVNLNAGTYSSINIVGSAKSKTYSGNNNVAIAHGSQINRVKFSGATNVAETAVLNRAFQSGAFNVIEQFEAGADKIGISKAVFGKLSAKNLLIGAGVSSATSAATKIIVNTSTGEIFYDADGSGAGAAQKIAAYTAMGGGTVSASNFTFVA